MIGVIVWSSREASDTAAPAIVEAAAAESTNLRRFHFVTDLSQNLIKIDQK